MGTFSLSIRVMRDDAPVRGAHVKVSMRSVATMEGYTESDGWVELEEDMNDDAYECHITVSGEYMGERYLHDGDSLSFSID